MPTAALVLALGLNFGTLLPVVPPACAAPEPPVPQSRDAGKEPAAERPWTISLRLENDVVAGTDQHYSSGASLDFSREDPGPLGRTWAWLGAGDGRLISSYEVGQLIITPQDISRADPDPADRPYAGLLYLGLTTQLIQDDRFQALKLIVGVVGPASLAAETQRLIHRVTGSLPPMGWNHQLENEPVVNLAYEHRRRYRLGTLPRGWGLEGIPRAGGMLGNILVQARAAGQFRFGYNLPDDFGKTPMRGLGNLAFPFRPNAARRYGVYVFAGGGAHLVARNLTLDGNTFREGPRVDRRPLFGVAQAGVSVWTKWFEASVSYVLWGREYEGQAPISRFGTFTLGFGF